MTHGREAGGAALRVTHEREAGGADLRMTYGREAGAASIIWRKGAVRVGLTCE